MLSYSLPLALIVALYSVMLHTLWNKVPKNIIILITNSINILITILLIIIYIIINFILPKYFLHICVCLLKDMMNRDLGLSKKGLRKSDLSFSFFIPAKVKIQSVQLDLVPQWYCV